MEKFKINLLILLYTVSLFITGLLVAVIVADPFRGKGISLGSIVLGVLFGIISFYLKHKIANAKDDIIENKTLNMAISNDGFVTAFEIAANNSLRLKDVNSYLNRCCESGICEKRYTEGNSVEVFYFRDSVSLEVKKHLNQYHKLKYN